VTLYCRLLCVGWAVAALACGSHAQKPANSDPIPTENILKTWLSSGDPRLEAWGAHDAVATHDQNLTPYLLSLVSKWQPLVRTCTVSRCSDLSPEQMDERDAMAAVLDTLIQMNVSVPADDLRNLAPDFGDYVAILLARQPSEESGPLSFDFYRSPAQTSNALQYVSATLLALHPPPGFAANLLSSIKVYAAVLVVNPGAEQPQTGSATSCGAYIVQPREGWPGIGTYGLSRHKGGSNFNVVGGAVPVYATRQELPRYTGSVDCLMSSNVYLSPSDRLQLIAEMLGVSPEAMPWETGTETKIEFKSLIQFDAELLDFVNEQQQKYRETASALADHGLLLPSEVEASLPELNLEIQDMRGVGAKFIPELPNLPPRVDWSYSYQ